MIITKRNRLNYKKILLLCLGALIVFMGLSLVLQHYHTWPFSASNDSSVNLSEPTSEQKASGATLKQNTVTSTSSDSKTSTGSDQPPSPKQSPSSGVATVNMTVTAANQGPSALQIRAIIEAVVSDGECTLSLQKDNATITRSSGVQALSTTSTCKGFDIPTSDLSAGNWELNLSYKNSSIQGTTSKVVTIR